MNRVLVYLRRSDHSPHECDCRRAQRYIEEFNDFARRCEMIAGTCLMFEPPHPSEYERGHRGSIAIRTMYMEPDSAESLQADVIELMRAQARELTAAADRLEAAS